MADIIDQAEAQNAMVIKAQIAGAKSQVRHRKGSANCLQCGEFNDRAHLGYGACTECTDEIRRNAGTA